MKLHFRGIQVPALGSPRDVVYREYLLHEAKVESKKHQLQLLIALATPSFSDEGNRRSWDKQAKNAFDEYVMMLVGHEALPINDEEVMMQKLYAEQIQNSKPILRRENGQLTVSNLPEFFADAVTASKPVKPKE